WDPAAQKFTSNFNLPNMALTTAGTPPIANGTFFAGHQCWSMGLGAGYPTSGCEHFGVSLSRGAGQTTYRWIVGDPATGVLTYADGSALATPTTLPAATAKPVPVLAPVAQVAAGEVQVVVNAPPPQLGRRYGDAMWVKVYKKEVPRQADLDELVGGHPNDNVPGIRGDGRAEDAVAQIAWKLHRVKRCGATRQ